ncbi:sensor histidine kinase [Granulicoccus sp. GXG6511]|uniref:sensor histidine kinase n=1 Tax=Granulicoccus sp. GXG6511 TaxID=3381351 RepID=UPI003D7DC2F0
MQRAIRTLAALQHVLFLALSVLGLGRGLATGAHPAAAFGTTALLLVWYSAGVLTTLRDGGHREEVLGPRPGRWGVVWLLGLTVCWLATVAASGENVWIAFPLWLLAGHLLPLGWAIAYAVVVLGVVVIRPWHLTGALTMAGVVGPTIGAAFALVVSRGQVHLVREALERQLLIASLVTAREETETLHAELATAQREAGALGERARLARDIHDTLAQGFSSIVLLARAGRGADDPERWWESLGRIEETARDNLGSAREVVAELTPADVTESGLVAALDRLLDRLATDTGIRTELHVDGDLRGLPTAVEVALLRTAQGALANVRRHARANRVGVSLSAGEDAVLLDVVDDGVGFDPGALPATPAVPGRGGYGLLSTRARLRELGGRLEIESAPGEGTALSAQVPLSATRPPDPSEAT